MIAICCRCLYVASGDHHPVAMVLVHANRSLCADSLGAADPPAPLHPLLNSRKGQYACSHFLGKGDIFCRLLAKIF